MKFNELNINGEILKAIEEMGFENLTPIQAQVIPSILDGKDIIGQAQTGTGKTAAFGIPLIQNSTRKNAAIEHLIISPTRELASQIKKELDLLAKYTGINTGLILGGVSYTLERRMLKSVPNILIGTPGRLLDHLKNNKIDLSQLKSLTLDEADEMLNIGFKEDLNAIIDFMPKERQSLLFSATLSKDVKAIAEKMLTNPIEVLVSSGLTTSKSVDQFAIICEEKEKFSILTKLIEVSNPSSAIIFGRTKRRADELANALNSCGFNARALHGDLSQKERTNVMDGFKSGQFTFLVATDVAARGIHVDGIEVVYNFDLPQEVEYYVHRIGRTGRAGSVGSSISFLRRSEFEHLRLIETKTGAKIKIVDAPSLTEVKEAKKNMAVEVISKAIESGNAMRHYENAKKLIEMYGAEVALAAALDIIIPKVTPTNVELTSEPPVRVRAQKSYGNKGNSNKRYSDNKRGNFKDSNRQGKSQNFGDKKKQYGKRP